ncbi:MAG: glutamate synthase large subunit [Planctomycetota bacterium]|jgi:glutamate synthase domain-containing protein 2/glutamate synthase domain-containing protein 1/glutamate synthase domain-containing protein 3
MSLTPKDQGLYESRREHDACGIGAAVNISGQKNHSIIQYAKQILLNLHHRGAASADNVTGDGAGILSQIPHEFFKQETKTFGFELPDVSYYGVGVVFGPKDTSLRKKCDALLEKAIADYGMKILGWRDVPVSSDCLGEIALSAEPSIKQIFIDGAGLKGGQLERKLYLARKRAERLVSDKFGDSADDFYVTSLSCKTICYKGMFMAWQLFSYYPDLNNEQFTSALAIVHQRYSTNTFPNWKLAQPFRCIAHNGEINTLSGNRNCMQMREKRMESPILGGDLSDLLPVLTPGASDSANFDNMLELLYLSGRSMPHSLMMMIPEAYGDKYHISADKRSFYEYHSSIMEPWDGPAAMVFTDGRLLGGTLDRNGLRPSRYTITTDGVVIMASETGVVQFPAEKIRTKGRLQPGKMFLVDTEQGRIITDNEIKGKISRQKPYRRWLNENRIELKGLLDTPHLEDGTPETLATRMRMFGYTREELNVLLKPMAVNGQEPVGSMGADNALAVLSDRPRLLYDYFKQLFAQVTNPPIDPLREGLVMSLMSFVGKKLNILDETPAHCRQLKLPHPVLTNEDMTRLRRIRKGDYDVETINAVFVPDKDLPDLGLEKAIDRLISDAETVITKENASLVIISDKTANRDNVPIPGLLAVSAVHHALIEKGLRGEAGLVLETGEAREVQHFCLLCGFGANGVNPYIVFETLHHMYQENDLLQSMEASQIASNYIAAVKKGILKTISKMGISTLRSYFNAQLFEAVGINKDVIDKYFTGTSSRIGGIGLEQIAKDAIRRHKNAYQPQKPGSLELEFGGDYMYRLNGERHLWNPTTVSKLQHAATYNNQKAYDEFAAAVNDQAKKLCTLRGLFNFKDSRPVPLEEVEPASEIVKRFCTGAMSHGSISKEAHECMAVAMNRMGAMSNTGEGGEDPARYTPDPNGDSKNSAIKQVASGRFGVTIHYLSQGKEIQIKMAQGAKPGEGGQLPGKKVTPEIATLRFSTPGVTLISPPPHHDIYSIEDLAQLIFDLRCANPDAKISVKLVSEVGVGTIAAGVAKGNADEVLISGYDGGTGASPYSSIKHAGCPWEIGLAETQQVLVMNKLRDRIRVQTDGQLRTGRDIVIAALLGAEQFGFGTGALVCLGCTLLRKCHEGACTYGIATQDPELRSRFAGRPEYIVNYMTFVAEEARWLMAQLGFRTINEMVGRVDMLSMQEAIDHYKAKGLDYSMIFHQPQAGDQSEVYHSGVQANPLKEHIDWKIIEDAKAVFKDGKKVNLKMPIKNTDRTVGTILSNRLVNQFGPDGLPDDTIEIEFNGSAGQSFGAFLIKGVTLKLVGDSNDYLGKGLSGGRIIVETPPGSPFQAHENIIVGNTLLYGATRGEVFINGMAGERFCVRNSGATAVVEGVGDHGCEYMTGGLVVVLGQTGCNFAAGMSGGIAYVMDEFQLFDTLCNLDMVDLQSVWMEEDQKLLYNLIQKHENLTRSSRARRILDAWPSMVGRFVKVIPIDYRKSLERMRAKEERNTDSTPATEEVFYG